MRLPPDVERKVLALAGESPAPRRKARGPAALAAPAVGLALTAVVPVRTVSEANARCHWSARHKRFREQAAFLRVVTLQWRPVLVSVGRYATEGGPVSVTFTRLGGRALDSDNLAGSAKGLRDELARLMEIDDGCPAVAWHYGQEPGGPVGVRVVIRVGDG